jgi:hypothetical protein
VLTAVHISAHCVYAWLKLITCVEIQIVCSFSLDSRRKSEASKQIRENWMEIPSIPFTELNKHLNKDILVYVLYSVLVLFSSVGLCLISCFFAVYSFHSASLLCIFYSLMEM